MADGYDFERYLNARAAHSPSFAPDGGTLSFLTNVTGVDEVWGVPVDPHAPPRWPEQLTFRGERVTRASFSPMAGELLVSADLGGNERHQLYRLSADGARLEALTASPETIHDFGGWSRDGRRIAYASNERDPRYFDVYARAVAGGEPRLLYQLDGTSYPLGFSPDGRAVLIARLYGASESNQLLLVDAETGAVRALTPEPEGRFDGYEAAQWSANGRGLYALATRGRDVDSMAWLDVDSGALTYLRDDPWDAEGLAVSEDGARLALVTNVDGVSRLELFDVASGWEARRELPAPELPAGVLSGATWSRDGRRLAFTLDTAAGGIDVWTWAPEERALWQATRSALGGIPRATFVAPRLVRYPTFDGREIPAFLYLPQGAEPRGTPAVVFVHGGPESQSRPIFNPVIQYLVGNGYAVLAPNVRGSSGYGHAYQSLDDVRQRMDSVADLRHAALWLGDSGTADPRRIAVMGGSYGGFMVLSAVTTYPELWAAGVDIVGIANFVTFLEHTGPWRRVLREVEYGSLERDREFLESISPIRSVDRIAAPLFVVHGANDPRVPVGEAEQIVAALRARGVPVEYLRFEDEGHGLIKRSNRLVAYPAIGRFLDRYVKGRA